jgi:hypothetical protein
MRDELHDVQLFHSHLPNSPLPTLGATVYTHLGSDTETLQDPPKSPLKRGTSDPVPSFGRRVREDQPQHSLDQITCVYTVAQG